jgi:hypothetical protein
MDRSLSLLANGALVSEYLYYEFRAVDHPLTHREIRELRALSTRAEITATSFVNTYEWGDFKGDPNILMEKYFDAFVYTANSCVFQLVLRLPRRALDTKDVSAFCAGESLHIRKTKNFTISFCAGPLPSKACCMDYGYARGGEKRPPARDGRGQ